MQTSESIGGFRGLGALETGGVGKATGGAGGRVRRFGADRLPECESSIPDGDYNQIIHAVK
ncbi:MAG: hypothetical protein NVS9B10_06810 [Nevskia sp.]